jgi:hypothetical protein
VALLSDASRGLGARLGKIIKHVIALDAYVWLNYEYMYGGVRFITLCKSITIFCGLTIFYTIFPIFRVNVGNIPQNIVSPIEQCYEFE